MRSGNSGRSRKAATRTQFRLGTLYTTDLGVPRNARIAEKLLRHAAHKGVSAAQLSLAAPYRTGNGVSRNLIEAYAWAEAAAELGEIEAQQIVDSVAKDMTPRQIAQAQARAQKYYRTCVAPFRES